VSESDDLSTAWHTLDVAQACAALSVSDEGLDTAQVAERLSRHGPNRLPQAAPRSAFRRLIAQFDNVLILVLIAAGVVAGLLGHYVDAGVIFGVVLINGAIGFIQEGRAEKALMAIRGMLAPRASVIRCSHRQEVALDGIVPGDIVILEPGDRVPADLRLLRARNLHIDEAALTGESMPVEKALEPVGHDAALAERTSMAYAGTLVTAGQGTGVTVATGSATELGKISALLAEVTTLETPLVRQMNTFGKRLTTIILVVCALVFVFGVLAHAYPAAELFMATVGLAVAAIPEGLPAVMTIALAIGVQRMARRNAIVRRLPAVETLGSVSVICSDKTGTLTRNEMTVSTVVTAEADYDVSGAGYAPHGGFSIDGREVVPESVPLLLEIARAAGLCNDARLLENEEGWAVNGDPMEGALLTLATKGGIDLDAEGKRLARVDVIPFDAEHRFMATLHHDHDGTALVYLKGAPERVLAMCAAQALAGGDAPLEHESWQRAIERVAARGQRVLAVATRRMAGCHRELRFADVEGGLTLLGLLALVDPPRTEAAEAVAECRTAGIRVKMITGDHAVTAKAIAAQLGFENVEDTLTGPEIEALSDESLRERAVRVDVFARAAPEHKLRLVQALQASGHVVSMTGDGVNDAPALKRADVGVAMGRKGTEAAKEAAEMVLADDNFASIVAAVREGRTVYDNLKKTIGWTLPTNGGEALTIIAAILFGLTLPLTAAQILWINMATAVTLGLTLAFEPTEDDAMRRPPRPAGEPLLSGFLLWRVVFVSILFALAAFGVFQWAEDNGRSLEEARTLVVNTIVVLEVFYLFSVRYLHATSLTWQGLLGTRAVLIGVGAVVFLQLAFTYLPPMQALFGTRAVSPSEGAVIILVGVALLAILEVEKLVWRRFVGSTD